MRIRNSDDRDAWDEFLDLYTPIVRAYCFQRRIQEADVDDIAQDVMSGVAKSIRSLQYDASKGRFRAWLGTVVANRIKTFINRNQYRNGKVTIDQSVSDGQYADPDSDWVAIFSERILHVACNRIRCDFANQTWECFQATWVRHEPAADVAKNLGIPVHSVYVNKSRVLGRLKAEIRSLADDLPLPVEPGDA